MGVLPGLAGVVAGDVEGAVVVVAVVVVGVVLVDVVAVVSVVVVGVEVVVEVVWGGGQRSASVRTLATAWVSSARSEEPTELGSCCTS